MSKKNVVEIDVDLAEYQILKSSKRIEYFVSEFTLEILAMKMKNEEYIVPDYQRAFTWEDDRKSKFLESIIIGLPIPFVFFWEDPDTGKLEIVDGSQRLRTIRDFLYNDFVLQNLEKIPAANGMCFNDFPASRRRKILNRSLRGITLNSYADEESRFDLFERINTGSKVANPAEVRRGALRGEFMNMVIELANSELFRKIAPVSKKQKDQREQEELVSRFFAYGDGLDEYADDVSRFVFRYIKKMNEEFRVKPLLIDAYKQRFYETMEFINNNFPIGFRKTEKATTTPRSRYEAIAIGTYHFLEKHPEFKTRTDINTEWASSDEFNAEVRSDGANAKKKLLGRIAFVTNKYGS
ncbi:DUF262 domain-containing protein [Escherichia coli]|uniref:GmrSD restriction endonucleases N-terminal domain-containing protein n=3 Tax=root TaxID=1 RepID=W1YU78_9ZZZZ|nr:MULTISPECIES: DUF262 domain-containing protein [Enterobacteriaceae]EJE8662141.1 DUF262 domain-containing protein [Shigella sonnei]HCA3403364.1 DUF262 domain-containing protein [Salmonella enterica subsp. enterica serovar Agona]EEW1508306.1 DUF262 domain-containing protein [Escherichia coli]EFB3477680.1 DUF262 domain-containing protein [Escherichia coli]EFE7028236.1 DUF262 domain-containing protein [Escherichia coli]